MQREFELCAETLQACEAAELGGADRIELCAALSEGGVSPSRVFRTATRQAIENGILPRNLGSTEIVFTLADPVSLPRSAASIAAFNYLMAI